MDKTQFCCDAYKKFAVAFQWFSYLNDDDIRIYLMPSIKIDGVYMRINNCPSCGKETRSIEIPADEYEELMRGVPNE